MSDPILKTFNGSQRRITAKGGLHMIRGNGKPYFSLTMSEVELRGSRWVDAGGGADHKTILKIWPSLKPLADLHLSDIDGVPMHAEANGWYWLAGALGGLGERYHGGSGGNYRVPTADGCMEIFARHVRLSINEARGVGVFIQDQVNQHGTPAARWEFAAWVKAQKPRWRAEADACIQALQLQVYGDQWVREAVPA